MNNKQYKSIEFFIGKDALDIGKGIQDFYIAFAYDDLTAFRHPRFFIRKSDNKGILRLNFYTYFPVTIPDKFKTELNKCTQVEVILSSNDNSEHISRYAPISHVLKFPEVYDLNLQPVESDTVGLVNMSDLLENSPLNQMKGLAAEKKQENEDDQIDEYVEHEEVMDENFEHISCQNALKQWLSEHKNFSMHVQKCKDHRLCIVTDNASKIFVICLFENAGSWLADEELFNEEPPLYFSETSHLVSPVFTAKAIADYWLCRTGLGVVPFVLLDDEIIIINEEDMSLEWMMGLVSICSCNRDYKHGIIKKFNAYMDELLESDGNIYTEVQIATLTKEFQAMDNHSVDDAMYYALRSLHLSNMLPETYTTGDIVRTWICGNYCECIWLARYWDKESEEFFDLVYNYSNVAIIWEHNKASVDPVVQVQKIRKKLLESGVESAMTPCILSGDENFEFDSQNIKCYNYNTFFSLEKNLFAREMEFEKYSNMSQEDVCKLISFANANFNRDAQKNKEKYDAGYEDILLDILGRVGYFFYEKKMFVKYETKLFDSMMWTITLQSDHKRTTIVLKSFFMERI